MCYSDIEYFYEWLALEKKLGSLWCNGVFFHGDLWRWSSTDDNLWLQLDTMICTGCCNTLDHIVTYVFRQLTAKGKKARKAVEAQQGAPLQLIRLMEMRPELLQQMLSCILNIIMFEECRNQYSMSRPLLGLILLNEEVSWISLKLNLD